MKNNSITTSGDHLLQPPGLHRMNRIIATAGPLPLLDVLRIGYRIGYRIDDPHRRRRTLCIPVFTP